MKFGATPVAEAEGAIAAHATQAGDRRIRKGRTLDAEDCAALAAAGIETIVAARLDERDLHEDAAAARLAALLTGPHLRAAPAHTGRANIVADANGLLLVDRGAVDAVNAVHEAITLATLPPDAPIRAGALAATLKIIPFAATRSAVDAAEALLRNHPPLRLAPYRGRAVGLIQTTTPALKPSLLAKTRAVLDHRLADLECWIVDEQTTPHDAGAVAEAIERCVAAGAELVLAIGASAIMDRADVIPNAVERIGGTVARYGMPVDPGNLLLLGARGAVPIVGLPGCVRSPKLNGADWVLRRLIADAPVDSDVVAGMGCGGLLEEIAEARPSPRARRPKGAPPRIGALLLAAGASRRMGGPNKLLAPLQGRPLVAHAAEALAAAGAAPLFVVTGRDAAAVRAALSHTPARFIHNPDFEDGLAASVRRGVAAAPENVDALLVALGDMPFVVPDDLRALMAAFVDEDSLIAPIHDGRRGNPILFGRSHFDLLADATGDRGAGPLLADRPMTTVEAGAGVLRDVDTPAALAAAEKDAAA